MPTRSGTPALLQSRARDLRRSWIRSQGTPAALVAISQDSLKSLSGLAPLLVGLQKTVGTIWPWAFCHASVNLCCSWMISLSSPVSGNTRGSPDLVTAPANLISPSSRYTSDHL